MTEDLYGRRFQYSENISRKNTTFDYSGKIGDCGQRGADKSSVTPHGGATDEIKPLLYDIADGLGDVVRIVEAEQASF